LVLVLVLESTIGSGVAKIPYNFFVALQIVFAVFDARTVVELKSFHAVHFGFDCIQLHGGNQLERHHGSEQTVDE